MKTLAHTFGNGSKIEIQMTAPYRPDHGHEGQSPIGMCKVSLSYLDCTCTITIDGKPAELAWTGRPNPDAAEMYAFRVRGTDKPEYGVRRDKIDPLIREEEAEARAARSPAWQAAYAVLSQPLPPEPDEEDLMRPGPGQAALWAQRKAHLDALEVRAQAVRDFLASGCEEARLCGEARAKWAQAAHRAVLNA